MTRTYHKMVCDEAESEKNETIILSAKGFPAIVQCISPRISGIEIKSTLPLFSLCILCKDNAIDCLSIR